MIQEHSIISKKHLVKPMFTRKIKYMGSSFSYVLSTYTPIPVSFAAPADTHCNCIKLSGTPLNSVVEEACKEAKKYKTCRKTVWAPRPILKFSMFFAFHALCSNSKLPNPLYWVNFISFILLRET